MKQHLNRTQMFCWVVKMALWFTPVGLFAQSSLYDIGQLQRIDLQFSQPDWDYQMDTAKAGADGYLIADYVEINGIRYDSVGVKYKGNSSYDSTVVKNPLHISLDKILNQSHEGYTDIKLGNCYADPSMIREPLAYSILKNYMHCPQANFAQLYINGSYIGLYSNVESINKEFNSNHYYSTSGTFFKCNPTVTPSPVTKSNLKLIPGVDSTGYFQRYELKSNIGWNDLVNLCTVTTNTPATLPTLMDMDRAIWMLAFNDLMVNLDSYSGVFCQNYYLYKDRTGHYNPTIWDLNMCFGGFPFLGAGATSTGSLTIPNMQQMPINVHATDPYWPLINAVMANPRYKRMYIAHLRTMAEEMIASGTYAASAMSMQATVDSAAAADNNKFFTYTQFQNGLTASAPNGSYTVPGISSLMDTRLTYLQSTPEFGYTPPSIANVFAIPASPALDSMVTITAQVPGADSVFLGYRLDQTLKFVRVPMYDDGQHGDAGAADGMYGASFAMSTAAAQYYIYAENAQAGIFSPARAEHEFHTLRASLNLPSPGDLVFNELLATNLTGQTDEAGQYEDWIELFNNTQSTLSLTGLYLTDNMANPTKYAFPSGTTIPPQGLLMVWADEDSSTVSYLHCNFKLASQGESLKLSDGVSLVLDSIYFGPQTADVSYGRCPDGTGSFGAQASPSFAALNCGVSVPEVASTAGQLAVFPNPASHILTVQSKSDSKSRIIVKNAQGYEIVNDLFIHSQMLDVGNWASGLYFVLVDGSSYKVMVLH